MKTYRKTSDPFELFEDKNKAIFIYPNFFKALIYKLLNKEQEIYISFKFKHIHFFNGEEKGFKSYGIITVYIDNRKVDLKITNLKSLKQTEFFNSKLKNKYITVKCSKNDKAKKYNYIIDLKDLK